MMGPAERWLLLLAIARWGAEAVRPSEGADFAVLGALPGLPGAADTGYLRIRPGGPGRLTQSLLEEDLAAVAAHRHGAANGTAAAQAKAHAGGGPGVTGAAIAVKSDVAAEEQAVPGNSRGDDGSEAGTKETESEPVAEAGAKEEEEEEEEKPEPWAMGKWDKLTLDAGWLVLFVAAVLALALVWALATRISSADSVQEEVADGTAKQIYEILCGPIDAAVMCASLLNFVLFALQSEIRFASGTTLLGLPIDHWVPKANYWAQVLTVPFFTMALVLRLMSSRAHPRWGRRGLLAPWSRLLLDVFIHVDIIAIIPSLSDLILGEDRYFNLTWLSLFRSIEMALRQPITGAGIRTLLNLFSKDSSLLNTMFVLGAVLWLMLSGLYFVANHNNKLSVWEAATYEGKPWQRFESIPSSMWFVLLNLCQEHPLADVFVDPDDLLHSWFQRSIVIFVCIIGVPFFALPTGMIGSMLCEQAEEEVQARRESALARRLPPAALQGETLAAGAAAEDEEPASVEAKTGAASVEAEPATEQEASAAEGDIAKAVPVLDLAVALLAFGSVFFYFYYTASPTRLLWVPVNVTPTRLAVVDGLVGLVFVGEWGRRLYFEGGYAAPRPQPLLVMVAVDALSCLPGLVHMFLQLRGLEGLIGLWLPAACTVRLLLPERHLGAFRDMFKIMSDHSAILKATGLISFLCLLAFSTLFWLTERDSPDEDLATTYGSVPRALWAEIINLHGEWPWCDYSAVGKCIGTFIALFSTGICMIPVAIFSDGFADQLSNNELEVDSLDMHVWELDRRPAGHGLRLEVFNTLYEHLLPDPVVLSLRYRCFRAASVLMTLLVTISTVLVTLPYFEPQTCAGTASCLTWTVGMWYLDIVATVFFAVELSMRLLALGVCYPVSLAGMCDVASLVAMAATLNPWRDSMLHPSYESSWFLDDMVIPARLLRIVMLESYFPAVKVLREVVRLEWLPLLRSGYALVCTWFLFGTVLYVFEHGSQDEEMQERYPDILTGLQHALVHLTGDYPNTAYSLPSMVAHFFFLILGMCVTGAFTGIFCAGFTNFLNRERTHDRAMAAQQRLAMITKVVLLMQRRFRVRHSGPGGSVAAAAASQPGGVRHFATGIVRRRTALGRLFMGFANFALVLNVTNTVVGTIPEAEDQPSLVAGMEVIELSTTAVFVAEYALWIASSCRPYAAVLKPRRLLDLVCILPALLRLGFDLGAHRWQAEQRSLDTVIECLLVCRVVRVLDFPSLRKEVATVGRTVQAALPNLCLPAVLALDVWVVTAGLFVWLEHFYDGPEKEHMESIPDALYWCSIYLLGEWANDTFSDGAGSRLCIFYCLVGVGLFSIPIGVIVEAAQSTLLAIAEETQQCSEIQKGGASDANGGPQAVSGDSPSASREEVA